MAEAFVSYSKVEVEIEVLRVGLFADAKWTLSSILSWIAVSLENMLEQEGGVFPDCDVGCPSAVAAILTIYPKGNLNLCFLFNSKRSLINNMVWETCVFTVFLPLITLASTPACTPSMEVGSEGDNDQLMCRVRGRHEATQPVARRLYHHRNHGSRTRSINKYHRVLKDHGWEGTSAQTKHNHSRILREPHVFYDFQSPYLSLIPRRDLSHCLIIKRVYAMWKGTRM